MGNFLNGIWFLEKQATANVSNNFQSELIEFDATTYSFLFVEYNNAGDTVRYHKAKGKLEFIENTQLKITEWLQYEFKVGNQWVTFEPKEISAFNDFERMSGKLPIVFSVKVLDRNSIEVLQEEKRVFKRNTEKKSGINNLVIWY
ncbi:MAG: hypothetical protein ACXITV_11325 [Luteibaculaceae bacterium]